MITVSGNDIVAWALFAAVKAIDAAILKGIVLDSDSVGCRNVDAAIAHPTEGIAIDLHVAVYTGRVIVCTGIMAALDNDRAKVGSTLDKGALFKVVVADDDIIRRTHLIPDLNIGRDDDRGQKKAVLAMASPTAYPPSPHAG